MAGDKTGVIHVHLADMPEVLWDLRRQMGKILRAEAEGEPGIVRTKLLAIADAFEAGLPRTGATGEADHA